MKFTTYNFSFWKSSTMMRVTLHVDDEVFLWRSDRFSRDISQVLENTKVAMLKNPSKNFYFRTQRQVASKI